MDLAASPLLTDLYQLNMIEAYLAHGETETAVFEFFVRKLPERARFPDRRRPRTGARLPREPSLLARRTRLARRQQDVSPTASSTILAGLRFTGDVHAMPEGRSSSPTSRSSGSPRRCRRRSSSKRG